VFGFLERSARSEPWWCDLFNGSGFRPGVGVKAVRNVVGILRVLGSCMYVLVALKNGILRFVWKEILANWMEPQGLA